MKSVVIHFRPTFLACCLALGCASVQAEGLAIMFADARIADPQFASARAAYQAAQTLTGQAMGQMLPQLSLNGARAKNNTDLEFTKDGTKRNFDYFSRTTSINLSLALIRPQLWAGLAQSQAQVRQAEAQYVFAGHDLTIRIAQAYFDALLAEDNVKLAGEQKAAISEQLQQAKRYFQAGVGTVTDINESQARYDTIVAQELAAESALEIRLRSLEQVVGKPYRKLDRLGGRLILESPEPDDVERWIEVALENNPQTKGAEAGLEVAQREVYRSVAAHFPTVDIVASRSVQSDPSYSSVDQHVKTDSIGLQFSIPLFSGGSMLERNNQTMFLRDKAQYDLEFARKSIVLATRQFFLSVINGVARVKALTQAVKSNELALHSARKGQEAGLRTSFDVLNAQQLLFTAKRDLAQARYDYVLARLKLRGASGLLVEDDIQLVQSWLDS